MIQYPSSPEKEEIAVRTTFIVKPVSVFCNLRCRYCFYHLLDQSQLQLMSEQTLCEVMRRCIESSTSIEFSWFGGEPLLAGVNFFEKVIFYQKKYQRPGQRIVHSIQTNGILLDREWIQFLKKSGFSIGLSIDGPKWLHDQYRINERGEGSFDSAMRALNLLQEYRIPFGILSVVHSANALFPEEVYRFFRSIKKRGSTLKLTFNHAKGIDRETGDFLPWSATPTAYAHFMNTIFDLWFEEDDPEIIIREFRSILMGLLNGRYRLCTFAGKCSYFMTIEYDGSVYPCDDTIFGDTSRLGHISEGFETLFHRLTKRNAVRLKFLREKCRLCRWLKLCKGGCLRDYYLGATDESPVNHFCQANQLIFSHIVEVLQKRYRAGVHNI